MRSKKKFLWFVVGVIIFCIAVGLVYSLFFMTEAKDLAKKSLSEVRQNFFIANDNLSNLSLSSGYREDPYAIDGQHKDVVPFGVVVFRTSLSNVSEPSFVLNIGDEVFEGVMERNPYDNTFVTDIENLVPDDSVVKMSIFIEDDTYNFDFKNISKEWNIDYSQAFEIGLDTLTDYIQSLKKGNVFNGECYVKVVSDPNNLLNIYYWYVAIVDNQGNSHAVVIDVTSGDVLSQS